MNADKRRFGEEKKENGSKNMHSFTANCQKEPSEFFLKNAGMIFETSLKLLPTRALFEWRKSGGGLRASAPTAGSAANLHRNIT